MADSCCASTPWCPTPRSSRARSNTVSSLTEEATDLLTLRSGSLQLDLAPAAGGAIAALRSRAPDGSDWHWLRPASAAALAVRDPLRLASFPLVPWCNRIRDSRLARPGGALQLPHDPVFHHAIHGLGWRLPWHVAEARPREAELHLRYRGAPGQWPWNFFATQRFVLEDEALHCTMSVRNDSDQPMPAGLGHHPYFPCRPGTRLQCDVAQMWATDAQDLPTQLTTPDFLSALRGGIELAALDLDHNFIGWQRRFRIEWPDVRRALVLEAESPLDFFVLYAPAGGDHFCAEPVSHCTEAFNLRGQHPAAALGGVELAPGETLQVRFVLRLESGLA